MKKSSNIYKVIENFNHEQYTRNFIKKKATNLTRKVNELVFFFDVEFYDCVQVLICEKQYSTMDHFSIVKGSQIKNSGHYLGIAAMKASVQHAIHTLRKRRIFDACVMIFIGFVSIQPLLTKVWKKIDPTFRNDIIDDQSYMLSALNQASDARLQQSFDQLSSGDIIYTVSEHKSAEFWATIQTHN